MPSLREVVAVLDALYRPEWADDWDAVGTVVGDPETAVRKILLAVDPVQAVVDEAVAVGADLVVTHHPLLLRGVTTVAASTPKGRVIHDLISNGIGLHTCHTNADSPALGVSESMALALGLTDLRPLDVDGDAVDKWIVYVPAGDADRVAASMHDAGAGVVGAVASGVTRAAAPTGAGAAARSENITSEHSRPLPERMYTAFGKIETTCLSPTWAPAQYRSGCSDPAVMLAKDHSGNWSE